MRGGVLHAPAAYFSKHPPRQYTDDEAWRLTEAWIAGGWGELAETVTGGDPPARAARAKARAKR